MVRHGMWAQPLPVESPELGHQNVASVCSAHQLQNTSLIYMLNERSYQKKQAWKFLAWSICIVVPWESY